LWLGVGGGRWNLEAVCKEGNCRESRSGILTHRLFRHRRQCILLNPERLASVPADTGLALISRAAVFIEVVTDHSAAEKGILRSYFSIPAAMSGKW
jgi:hypothetical protein